MKCQDLFSLKKNNKKLSSAAVVIGALRVNALNSGALFYHNSLDRSVSSSRVSA